MGKIDGRCNGKKTSERKNNTNEFLAEREGAGGRKEIEEKSPDRMIFYCYCFGENVAQQLLWCGFLFYHMLFI